MRSVTRTQEANYHIMDEHEARQRLAEYLPSLQGDTGYQLPSTWLTDTPVLCHHPNGDWMATCPGCPSEGVLLKSDGTNLPFFGALGKIIPHFGWLPASREYFLASALQGRYQVYEQGLAVWENFEGIGDAGHPVAQWPSIDNRARSCFALIAFFDLRGFTTWSSNQDPKDVQDTIEHFEKSFQNAFSRPWCQQIFAKGTGDGFMVVSEAGRYTHGPAATEGEFQSGHVKAFCLACAKTVEDAAKGIPNELAVGCGVTLRRVTQLYLLGRPDYIGPKINDASKIQAIAYGELCLSTEVVDRLRRDGVDVDGKSIPTKGIRLAVADLIQAAGRLTSS